MLQETVVTGGEKKLHLCDCVKHISYWRRHGHVATTGQRQLNICKRRVVRPSLKLTDASVRGGEAEGGRYNVWIQGTVGEIAATRRAHGGDALLSVVGERVEEEEGEVRGDLLEIPAYHSRGCSSRFLGF